MKFYQTKGFKKAQSDWYKRLEKEGFSDIEDTASPMEKLKEWHSFSFSKPSTNADGVRMEARQVYFDMAQEFFERFEFTTEKERAVWELHSKGMSVREISRELHRRQGYGGVSPTRIIQIVMMLQAVMKEYLLSEVPSGWSWGDWT